jgi:hypothetical protein
MAASISPTNPGVIYDPRARAAQGYLDAVQADLQSQTKDFGLNIQGNREIYDSKYKPLPGNLFTPDGQPNPELQGFQGQAKSVGPFKGFSGVIGVLGGVRRIG